MYKFSAIAAVIVSALVSTVPAHEKSVEIGPNGVRANPDGGPQIQRDRRPDRGGISERRTTRIARDEGMDKVESVVERRNAYIVRGIDRRDNDMRVVIDRRTGEVLEVH